MSATAAEARRRPDWSTAPAEPIESTERGRRLAAVHPVAGSRKVPRTVCAVVAVGTLLGIVTAQLLLSITVSQGAYQVENLQNQQAKLQRDFQAAQENLNRVASPQNLAANANALGMVSNASPVYLRLSDGAVLGVPAAAAASAGTVTGRRGNLIPNVLLNDVPLVTGALHSGPAGTAKKSATPSGTAAKSAGAPVALQGALPSPTTH